MSNSKYTNPTILDALSALGTTFKYGVQPTFVSGGNGFAKASAGWYVALSDVDAYMMYYFLVPKTSSSWTFCVVCEHTMASPNDSEYNLYMGHQAVDIDAARSWNIHNGTGIKFPNTEDKLCCYELTSLSLTEGYLLRVQLNKFANDGGGGVYHMIAFLRDDS